MKTNFKDLLYSRAITVLEQCLAKDGVKPQDIKNTVLTYSSLHKAAQVFLFDEEITGLNNVSFGDIEPERLEYPLPFKTCYFETNDKDLSLCSVGTSPEAVKEYELHAILITENAPASYSGLLYLSQENVPYVTEFKLGSDVIENGATFSAAFLVDRICRYIHSCNMGSERVFRRVTQKTVTQGKCSHVLESVIRLRPKISSHFPEPAFSREIDWSMRWWVRGHWRKLPAPEVPGKDRNGEYSVNGFTWVTEHLRGPEDKPIRKSTYVMEASCQQ